MFEECKNCQENNWVVDESRGDVICFHCGMTLSVDAVERITYSEGKTYSSHFSPTVIRGDIAKTHRYISGFEILQDQHLHGYWVEIKRYCALLNLSIQKPACNLILEYEKAQESKKRSDSFKAGALAAIFIACKEARNGKTLEQLLLFVNDVSDAEVLEAHDKILGLIPRLRTHNLKLEDVVREQCRLLALSNEVGDAACKLYTKCEAFIDGLSLGTISAGCIYLACRLMKVKVIKEDVAVSAVISPATLDNFCRTVDLKYPVSILDLEGGQCPL